MLGVEPCLKVASEAATPNLNAVYLSLFVFTTISSLFWFIFVHLKKFLRDKRYRIISLIVRVEGEHTDHMTSTTTAQLYVNHFIISGKSFLNTVEYLDPFTDEWTTFIPVDKIDFPEEEDDDDAANVVDNDCDDVDQEIEISNADDVETSKSVTPTDDFDDDAKLASLGENVTNDDIPDLEEVNQAQPSCIDDAVEGVQDEAVVAIDVEGVHNDDVAIDVVSVENGATAVDSDE